MKTILTLLITCILGFLSVAAQNKKENKTHRERESLSGAVKSIETYQVEFLSKDGIIIEQKRLWITNFFTVDGKLSERTVYAPEGGVNRDIYAYNENGENIECKTHYSDFKDKSKIRVQTYIHTFDDRGNLLERKVFEHEGNLSARFVYNYDEKGNEIEYRNYFHTGALGGKIISTYNDNGNMLSRVSYKDDNTIAGKDLFVVNDKGQKIEQTIFIGEILRYKILYKYDGKGRILERETLEFNTVPNSWTSHAPQPGKLVFIYDDQNKTREEIRFNTDGAAEENSIFKYDDKENLLESIRYKYVGRYKEIIEAKDKTPAERKKLRGAFQWKAIFQYDFDIYGNWTKKTRLVQTTENEKPKPSEAEHRVIKYY